MLSAGVIPVFMDRSPEVLLLRAFRYWDFPKGLVNPHEDPLKAALRELKEEAGIVEVEFSWGKDYVETEPYSKGKIARYYLARASNKTVRLQKSSELGRPEHMEYRWLKFDEARKLLVPRVQKVLDWSASRILS